MDVPYETEFELPDGYRLVRCGAERGSEALRQARDILAELASCGKDTHYVVDETDEEFIAYFSDPEMLALGIIAPDGSLAGAGVGSFRREAVAKFARFIPQDICAQPKGAGYVEFIQVGSAHRGHGFQRIFFAELEKWFASQGTRFLTGTVSPENMPSLTNFHRMGYVERGDYVMSCGFPRFLMVKELTTQE